MSLDSVAQALAHIRRTHAVAEKHTLETQRKDRLQLNYGQIEPWERRSSKAELEPNAEAVSHKHSHLCLSNRQATHTQASAPQKHKACLPGKIYATSISYFVCPIHIRQNRLCCARTGVMNRYTHNMPVQRRSLCKCVRAFVEYGGVFLHASSMERGGGCSHCDYKFYMHPSGWKKKKQAIKKETMPSQSKGYHIIKLPALSKTVRYDNIKCKTGNGKVEEEEQQWGNKRFSVTSLYKGNLRFYFCWNAGQ